MSFRAINHNNNEQYWERLELVMERIEAVSEEEASSVEITRIKNRIARWFSIYFPEIKDVYRNPDSVSGLMILKEAPLPQDIVKLGVDGINKIWRDAKLRAAGSVVRRCCPSDCYSSARFYFIDPT